MSEENKENNFHVKNLLTKIKIFLSKEKPADILIIKAHLLCEYYVNQLLVLREICTAKELESLTFYEKIEKAFVLTDKKEKLTFDCVHRLNKLRNKVGHELEYSLSESDVDSLGYAQGKDYILNKYDVETNTERLHDVLTNIVIEIALLLINTVESEKKKKKISPSGDS